MSELPYLKVSLDWDVWTRLLTDEEKGRLIDAMVRYARGEENADDRLTGNEVYVYPMFCVLINRDKAEARKHLGVPSKERHWNWKGGITPENQKERGSWRYSQWRKAVFERDNYTCQKCGKRGGELNAHHKKLWANYRDLRFEVSNGITLCAKCHKAVHKKQA